MDDSTQHEHAEALHPLVAAVSRLGLREPASLVLDILRPLDVVSSQMALFLQPFAAGSRWGACTRALTDETGWVALRQLLEEQDKPDEPDEPDKQSHTDTT